MQSICIRPWVQSSTLENKLLPAFTIKNIRCFSLSFSLWGDLFLCRLWVICSTIVEHRTVVYLSFCGGVFYYSSETKPRQSYYFVRTQRYDVALQHLFKMLSFSLLPFLPFPFGKGVLIVQLKLGPQNLSDPLASAC